MSSFHRFLLKHVWLPWNRRFIFCLLWFSFYLRLVVDEVISTCLSEIYLWFFPCFRRRLCSYSVVLKILNVDVYETKLYLWVLDIVETGAKHVLILCKIWDWFRINNLFMIWDLFRINNLFTSRMFGLNS